MIPRPVRNNNPLDIEATQPWAGMLRPDEMTPDQRAEDRFAVFSSPAWGFRAGLVLVRNYWRFYGINTIDRIVARFAPGGENDLAGYVRDVEEWTGIHPSAPLDMENPAILGLLVWAFTRKESGGWNPPWSDSELEQGAKLAGFVESPLTLIIQRREEANA